MFALTFGGLSKKKNLNHAKTKYLFFCESKALQGMYLIAYFNEI